MKALLLVALVVIAPAAASATECGWCGRDAQALGRALNMGGPAPCYCPDPPVVSKQQPVVVQPKPKPTRYRT